MSRKVLYGLLSVGLIGTFFGHGAWAVGAKDSFLGLLADSMDNVFGYSMSESTAEAAVRTIGVVDIVLSIAMAAMLYGVVRGGGRFHALAYSPIAIGVYAWAVLWGFLTAASRMTAAGVFFPEVWDLVERAPNFMIPAALLYLVVSYRKTHPEAPVFVPEEFKSRPETAQELTSH